VTPRRWLAYCNPELSALITATLGSDSWITDTVQLQVRAAAFGHVLCSPVHLYWAFHIDASVLAATSAHAPAAMSVSQHGGRCLLQKLKKLASDATFQAKWKAVKQTKKAKLAAVIKQTHGDDVNMNALFDIQVRPYEHGGRSSSQHGPAS
jgi:starch phosphorylase